MSGLDDPTKNIRTFRSADPRQESLAAAYKDSSFVTLYRYENPAAPYDEAREGAVSKAVIIGQWFTSDLNDLRTYIKMRQPGGHVAVIRVPASRLHELDAANLPATRDMDREVGNYIVPEELQSGSRLEIPLPVTSRIPNKFLIENFKDINAFVDTELTTDAILKRVKS